MPSSKKAAAVKALCGRMEASLPDFFLFSLIMVISYGAYRVGVWAMIREMLPNLKGLNPAEYLLLSANDDGAVQLFSLAVLMLLFLLISAKPLKYALAGAFTAASGLALLAGSLVFGIYETTVQRVMMTDEFFSGLDKLALSMLAETSCPFFVLAALALLAPAAASVFLTLKKSFSGGFMLFARFYALGLFILMLLLTCLPLGKGVMRDGARITGLGAKQAAALLRDVTMNPNYNILFEKAQDTESLQGVYENRELRDEELGLSVDSLSMGGRTERINILPRGKRYSIVLYLFESTCAKMLSYAENGKPAAAQWQRLMKHSIAMENHYANYPLSANALFSALTSAYEYPGRELAVQGYPNIPLKTLPELLRPLGYRSMLIHTGSLRYANQREFLEGRGFDRITDTRELKKIPPYNTEIGWGIDDRALIAPVMDFIKEKREAPFFAVVMPVNPHHPYAVPEDTELFCEVPEDLPKREYNRRKYLNSLHYSDGVLGSFAEALEAEGLTDNTLLFVLADHGEAFYEHRGNYNHPFFLYEENVHVPFIIYSRELIDEPVKIQSITSHVDIVPTILDLLNIPSRPEQEGASVLSAHRERMALLHTNMRRDFEGLRDGKWKYILDTENYFEELYDLEADAGEKHNAAQENPEIAGKYRAFLERARSYKGAYYAKFLKGVSKAKVKSLFDTEEITYEEYSEAKRLKEE